jgi:ribose 1,5-bisphosphate isomerase
LKWVTETSANIKRLEIQGATNIAKAGVKALTQDLMEADTIEQVDRILGDGVKLLVNARSTEPMLRNGLKFIRFHVENEWTSKQNFIEKVAEASAEILNHIKIANEKIVEIGSKRVRDGDTILTHCHSSAVTSTLIRAFERGVDFKVIQTETRPKYQGRITARELVNAGIDTTMIVDSAARHFMREVNFVLVGCDAITSEGNIINKIGTSQVSLAANEARVPFYVISSLLKFDPVTILGDYEVLEEREADEVWENPPKKLKIRNPAFEVTRRDYVHGMITEMGIISPHSVLEAVDRCYPWVIE